LGPTAILSAWRLRCHGTAGTPNHRPWKIRGESLCAKKTVPRAQIIPEPRRRDNRFTGYPVFSSSMSSRIVRFVICRRNSTNVVCCYACTVQAGVGQIDGQKDVWDDGARFAGGGFGRRATVAVSLARQDAGACAPLLCVSAGSFAPAYAPRHIVSSTPKSIAHQLYGAEVSWTV